MYIVQQFENEREKMIETIIYEYTGYFIIAVTCIIFSTIIIYIVNLNI